MIRSGGLSHAYLAVRPLNQPRIIWNGRVIVPAGPDEIDETRRACVVAQVIAQATVIRYGLGAPKEETQDA